jgi:YgiT-type zinc finger domain-containing protein
VADAFFTEGTSMKCSIQGCPGTYEPKRILHTIGRGDDVQVFTDVPAEVCDVCSDTLLAPGTVRRLEELAKAKKKPHKYAPLYEYA